MLPKGENSPQSCQKFCCSLHLPPRMPSQDERFVAGIAFPDEIKTPPIWMGIFSKISIGNPNSGWSRMTLLRFCFTMGLSSSVITQHCPHYLWLPHLTNFLLNKRHVASISFWAKYRTLVLVDSVAVCVACYSRRIPVFCIFLCWRPPETAWRKRRAVRVVAGSDIIASYIYIYAGMVLHFRRTIWPRITLYSFCLWWEKDEWDWGS